MLRKYYNKVKDSAIDHALTVLWVAAVGLILSLAYFIKSTFEPYWLFFAGFGSASILIVLVSVGLILLKSYRIRKLEEERRARFASTDKGYLDHRVDMEQAGRELVVKTTEIANEIRMIGNETRSSSSEIIKQKDFLKKQKLASKLAKKYHKRYAKIEKLVSEYEELNKLQIEGRT